MRKTFRYFFSILLLISMVLGFTGCYYDKAACDQVCAAAEEVSQALIDCDRNRLLELSTEDYDIISTHDWLPSLDLDRVLDEDKFEVVDYIRSTMTIDISPGTVDASLHDGTGEIDVYLTMVNYDNVYADETNVQNIRSLMRALRNEEDVKLIRITMTFVYEDGEWKVSNLWDVYCAVYGFLNVDVTFPHPVSEAVIGGQWQYLANPVDIGETANYSVTSVIEMDLVLDPEVPKVDCSGVYYTVSFEDELVYTSDPGTLTGIYGPEQDPDYTRAGYLNSGSYSIAFYDENDELLCENTATVGLY